MLLQNSPALETERLVLRKFNENDLMDLYTIYRDKEVNTYLPWFPLHSLEEAGVFFQKKYAEAYMQPEGYRYAICLKSDNVAIGYINVSMDKSHDLGYGLIKKFWHKGIAAEAGKKVIEQLIKDGIPYITATHDIKNPSSGCVMRKLGMKYQYSFEEQWQPKDILVTFRMYQLNFNPGIDQVFQEYRDKSAVHYVETGVM